MIVTGIAVAYLIAVLVIGLRARNQQSSTLVGYVAGGREVGLIILFFIMGAEIFSAFAFLGGPGWAYDKGAPALYIMAYLGLGLLPWWVLGPKTARLGRKYGYLTQADLMSDRFSSKGLSAIVALVSVGAFIPYLTLQITGAGYLFRAATDGNVPFWLGALAAFVIVTIYVYVSGLRGIGWTNVIQGIIMVLVAWWIGMAVADRFYGGVGQMFREIQAEAPQYLTLPGVQGMSWAAFSSIILVSAIGFTMWPHLFMKAYGADSEKTIKKTIIIYPLYGYLLVPTLIIGFAGILVFRDSPLENPDNVLPELVVNEANFSPWLVGIMLSGALAAAMSTGSNLAHTASTVLVRDLFVAVFRQDMPERQVVLLTRIFVVVISVVAYVLALFNPASLVGLLLGAYGAVVQFFPLIVAVFFWKRATKAGAFAGLISGSAVMLYFSFLAPPPFEIHAGIWGLLANTVALVAVSLLTEPMPEEHVERFVEGSKASLEEISGPPRPDASTA
ncbi:putative symporter YodF [Rubrobacter xylanophilus DSM 9941]|uniref:sodium:solute symporter family protein n=1 Tax=Rubrobacter xylanophilus TaxID=49319 RepID=UPI001C63BC6B|nr:sodium:solute symporter family protein [Rubrobacter xylanophilus]QYJ16146.1 putative symporter YodF [Rubrobacter xylanophilus DSM 9941]